MSLIHKSHLILCFSHLALLSLTRLINWIQLVKIVSYLGITVNIKSKNSKIKFKLLKDKFIETNKLKNMANQMRRRARDRAQIVVCSVIL